MISIASCLVSKKGPQGPRIKSSDYLNRSVLVGRTTGHPSIEKAVVDDGLLLVRQAVGLRKQ
jgi:hypothetical protein